MKYGRQRFLIFFLYAALPVVALFALVQTPYVSDLILNFSLRVVRFRTGVHITAQGWQVKPLQFAAELSTIHVETGRIVVDAPSVQVWVSPLYLLMGEVHLNDLRFDRPKVSGTLPPDFFAKKNSDNSFLKDFFKKDVPTEFGQLVEKGVNFVAKRNLYLEKFSLVNAEVQVGEIQGQRVSLELDNLGAGQLHLDLDLVKFEIKKQLQLIPSFKASFGLLKADKKKFTLVVPEFEVHLDDKSINTLRANGSWPGESRLILGLELKQLFTWIKASPLLGDIGVKALAGTVKGDFTVRVANKGFQTFNGSAQTEGLKIDEFYPNNLSISVEGTPERTEISQVSIRLPFEVGDNPSWHHRMDLEKIVIEKGAITGSMKLDQAGLCGILLASGIDECFSPLKFSGKAQFSGKIDPFEIDVNPDITMEGGEVHTDPVQQHKDSRLLVIKSAKVTGMVQVFAKKVVFPNSVLSWGTDSSANCNGEVTYKPTLVGLNIRSSKAEFKPLIASFLDLEVLGTAEINARVDYSIKLSKAEGRTKVAASVNMINAGIEGQNFGTAIGDVTYKKNELTIGPMRVTNGGGQAIINGKLVQKSGNSFLTLDGDMQRLEVRAITPQAGTEIFSGFATGKMAIAGYTNSKSPEFLSGPFNFDVDNFKVFGVPFQKGQIKAEYKGRRLIFNEVKAERSKSFVTMTGTLNPDSGSELKFHSTSFPVREIGVEPKLKIFQKGLVSIDGWWKPAKGWLLKGLATQLKVAGSEVPDGQVEMGGEENTFHFDLGIGDVLKFNYQSKDLPDNRVRRDVRADMHDQGLYLGFAYLKEWNAPYPIHTQGRLHFKSVDNAGRLDAENLKLISTDIGSRGPKEILIIDGKKSLAWEGSNLTANDFSPADKDDFTIDGGIGAHTLAARYNLDLRLLDLFVPVFKFQSGRLIGKAEIPLPLNINTISAQAEVRGGSLFLDSLGHSIDGVRGNLDISRSNLSMRHVEGSMGAGEIKLDGIYRLDPLKPSLSLQVGLNRAHLVLLDDVPLDVSGEVTLRGDTLPYSLAGRVQVNNLAYSKEFNEESALPDPNLTPMLLFGLEVELGSGVFVRNSLADIELGGRVLVGGNNLQSTMQGRLLLQRGAVIANENRFQLIQGYVDFPGGASLNPILNLQASSQVQAQNQTYKIDLKAQGSVKDLNIDFSSDPPLANSDIVSLLAFGVLNNEQTQTTVGTNDLIGAARVEALQMIFGKAISSNIDRTTGFQVRLKAEQDQRQQDFIPKVTVERRLSDRVTATYGQSIDATKDSRDLQVDYHLLNNMNLSGVWEENQDKESSVGVDLRFRFDVK